jgi:hypothetical protein
MVHIQTLSCWDHALVANGDGWRFPAQVRTLLENRYGGDCIHLFGGKASFGIRLDIDPLVEPDVLGDAWQAPFRRDSARAVILDPPYAYVNSQMTSALMARAAWIAREEVAWFHNLWIESKIAELKLAQAWAVVLRRGSSVVRCLEIFTVAKDKRVPRDYIERGPGVRFNRWHGGRQLGLPMTVAK